MSFRYRWVTLNNSQLIEDGILEIGDGYRAKNSEMGASGLPFARAGNINNGFHFNDADLLDQKNVSKVGSKISQAGDVVFTSKGTVGRFAFVRSGTPKFVYSPQLCYWRIKDTSIIDPRFLFYWMHGRNFSNQVHQVKGLTDMADYVSLGDQRKMKITVPPLPTQHKIASILSAYDDLIENNTRRIAILEEMAQSLYREWFVHFRFPGHEKKSMVESALGMIPEGWEVRAFSEIADFVNGFAFEPHHWGKTGKPIIKIAELKNGITSKTPFYHGPDIPIKYHVRNGDVLFSWSADLDAYIWSGGQAYLNQHLFNVLPFKSFGKIFLFYLLRDHMLEFRSKSQGTTMRHIKRSALDQVKAGIPAYEQRIMFESYIEPMILEIQNIMGKISNLRQTRDLLLPKLISGEVDVEGLDICIEGE